MNTDKAKRGSTTVPTDEQHLRDLSLRDRCENPVATAENPAEQTEQTEQAEQAMDATDATDATLKAVARIFALGAARAIATGRVSQSQTASPTATRAHPSAEQIS